LFAPGTHAPRPLHAGAPTHWPAAPHAVCSGTNLHVAEQQSVAAPFAVPSSHCSPNSMTPLPQTVGHALAMYGTALSTTWSMATPHGAVAQKPSWSCVYSKRSCTWRPRKPEPGNFIETCTRPCESPDHTDMSWKYAWLLLRSRCFGKWFSPFVRS